MNSIPSELAIIGGTGLTRLPTLKIIRREVVHTPYGEPSGPVTHGELFGHQVAFIPRHGAKHNIPPHRVNYRANLWALRHLGIKNIIAVAAVGGISSEMRPCRIAIPDQIIDYTWSRMHTYFDEHLDAVTHIDFSEPYCRALRGRLVGAAQSAGLDALPKGVYAATQGPRLETAAEINRLEKDGCDMVGMTGMPEAALARELDLCYASIAVVANWAAGRGERETISLSEISRNLEQGMNQVKRLLEVVVTRI